MESTVRTIVQSSTIKEVAYSPVEHRMYVKFHEGKTYVYDDVPKRVYCDLITAESVGKQFALAVRDVYEYQVAES